MFCVCVCVRCSCWCQHCLARYKKYIYSVSHNHPILSLVTALCLLSRERALLRLLTSHKSVSSLCVFHFTRPLEIRCCLLLALRRVGVLHLPERSPQSRDFHPNKVASPCCPPQSRAFATRTRLQVLPHSRGFSLTPDGIELNRKPQQATLNRTQMPQVHF